MTAFMPLFSLGCRHEFFAGGACPAVEFMPTLACGRQIASAGLLLRQGGGSVCLYYEVEHPETLPEAAAFDFLMYVRDPEFAAYTEGLPKAAGQALHFEAWPEEGPQEVRLGRDGQVSAADLIPADQAPRECRMYSGVAPVCSVRIHAGGALLHGQAYYLDFRARRTTWLYYVSSKGVAALSMHIARNGGTTGDFDGGSLVMLPNGLQACVFRSTSPLPLLRDQPRRYALKENASGRTVLKTLPVPSPRGLGHETQNGVGGLTSPMFVNL